MRYDQTTEALYDGYKAMGAQSGTQVPTFCEFAAGVHAYLTRAAKESGWARAIILRAAAGWVTDWSRRYGCP